MKTPWTKTLAAAVIVSTAPANAIPVTFDFSGTIAQVLVVDSATGVPTIDLSTAGQAFGAQFIIDTDLFGPGVASTSQTSDRLAFSSELPGAVTSSLMINGESIDLAPFSSNRANSIFLDSLGVVSCGELCSRIAPDQFNVNVLSEDSTPLGISAARSLSFSFVAGFPGFDDPEPATSWFSLSPDFDIDQLASLSLPDSVRPSVLMTDFIFDCTGVRCQQTAFQRTLFNVTSASRTVASVPEPGALGLLAFGIAAALFTRRRKGGSPHFLAKGVSPH